MTEDRKSQNLVADNETLERIFHRPESDQSRLVLTKYMEQILFGLHDFLKDHVGITEEIPLKTLASRFSSSDIAKTPVKKLTDVIAEIIEDIAPTLSTCPLPILSAT
jgi:glutamate decarboxylase